jgi:tRNA-binding protein
MNTQKDTTSFDNFLALDIRAGTIIDAKPLPKAKIPAYALTIDFGETIGVKHSSARISDLYTPQDLINLQIMAIINFPPRKIAGFTSEVLVCGFYNENNHVVLVTPQSHVQNGAVLG